MIYTLGNCLLFLKGQPVTKNLLKEPIVMRTMKYVKLISISVIILSLSDVLISIIFQYLICLKNLY